jgi:hypothetical protein
VSDHLVAGERIHQCPAGDVVVPDTPESNRPVVVAARNPRRAASACCGIALTAAGEAVLGARRLLDRITSVRWCNGPVSGRPGELLQEFDAVSSTRSCTIRRRARKRPRTDRHRSVVRAAGHVRCNHRSVPSVWPHAGLIRNEEAFPADGGVARIPASSDQLVRDRVHRKCDLQLQRILHTRHTVAWCSSSTKRRPTRLRESPTTRSRTPTPT